MVIAETVNRRGRLLIAGQMMQVQTWGRGRNGVTGKWLELWTSECLDDDDIAEGIDFMEEFCDCHQGMSEYFPMVLRNGH